MNGAYLKRLAFLAFVLLPIGLALVWKAIVTEPRAPDYRTVTLTKGELVSSVSATGTLQAVTRVEVGSQVSGVIDAIYVSHNSRIRSGQLLAQIDASAYRAAVTQAAASVSNVESLLANAEADAANATANARAAEAAVMSAQAAVQQAKVGVLSAGASVSSAQARLRKAESLLENSRKSYERSRDLLARELIALSELDTASTDLRAAEADLQSAQADLAGVQAGLESARVTVASKETEVESARLKKEAAEELVVAAQARVRGYRAQVAQAQASLRAAEINLQRTSIIAPIDGIVLEVAVTSGQTVAAQLQAPNLFTLAQDLREMQVETLVDESDISRVKAGASARFTVDAYPEESFSGKVTEVRQSPVSSNGVVTYLTIVRTSNPAGKLKPGMTATVEIVEHRRAGVLKIPNEALGFRPPGSVADSPVTGQVYTLDGEGLARHTVTTGLSDGSDSELTSGDLKEGDQVVVSVISSGGLTVPDSSSRRPGPPGMF